MLVVMSELLVLIAKLGTNGLDVSNTAVLNIAAGGVFADASLTSTKIAKINIGDVY